VTPRQIRCAVISFAEAIIAAALGSRRSSHRLALAWVLATAPILLSREVRRNARADLVFHLAMTSNPRPPAKCGARALNLGGKPMSIELQILQAVRDLPNARGSLKDVAPIVALKPAHLVSFARHLVELKRLDIVARAERGNPYTSEKTIYAISRQGIARIDELERRAFQEASR